MTKSKGIGRAWNKKMFLVGEGGMMADLSALIARLEQATKGSRELDLKIQIAVGREYAMHHDRPVAEWSTGSVPPYTTSLDAALTLVPEGIFWVVGVGKGYHEAVRPMAYISNERSWIGDSWGYDGIQAATPALALVIAALKARSA